MTMKSVWVFIIMGMAVATSKAYSSNYFDENSMEDPDVENLDVEDSDENMISLSNEVNPYDYKKTNKRENAIGQKEEMKKKNVVMDLLSEKITFSLKKDNDATHTHSIKILNQYYRLRLLKTTNTEISGVAINSGELCYKKKNSDTLMYKILNDELVPVDEFENPSFFTSMTLNYSEPSYLKVGELTIKTKVLHNKYRVASHIQENIYFIGYSDNRNGKLYATEINGFSENVIEAEDISSVLNMNIMDLAIDHYTGNILFCKSDNKIYLLELMTFMSQMIQLEKLIKEF